MLPLPVVVGTPAADLLPAAGPLPRGRPGFKKRERAIDAEAEDARAVDSSAKSEMYLRKPKQFIGQRKSKAWGEDSSWSPKELKRKAEATEAASAWAEAVKQSREGSIAVKQSYVGSGEGVGDLYYVSEAQKRRVRLQAMSATNYFMLLGESYDEKGREWSMPEAALRCGSEVKGAAIYKRILEFREHDRHFKVDKRGMYVRCFFVDNEDVNLKVKAWTKSNLRHLSRDKFAKFVNETPIAVSVEGGTAMVASIAKKKWALPVCPETFGMWMRWCGAKYCAKTQSFYRDKHEDPDNRAAHVR